MMFRLLWLTLTLSVVSVDANRSRYDALELAASRGDTKDVSRFLNQGLKPSGRSGKPNAPILFAISSGRLEVVKLLLDAGVNPNFSWGKSGGTLLTNGVQFGKMDIVKLLIERGADVNAAPGYSALYRAEILHNEAMIQALTERGARLKPGEAEILKSLR